MTRPSPIVFINSFPGESIGGGETQLLSLARGLIERGEEVAVVAARDSRMALELEGIDGLTVHSTDFRAGSPTSIALSIARDVPYASVVVGTGFFANIVARQLGVAIKSRIVNIIHVVPGANRLQGEKLLSRLARWALDNNTRRFVDRWVAVSDAVARGLIADKVRSDRIVTIPNGIDAHAVRTATSNSELAELRDTPRVGFVGRLERIKAPEMILRLAERMPDAEFVVAGTGSLLDELKDQASMAGIGDRIVFLGFVEDAVSLIASLDVLVVPSRSESLGMAILEAQVSGVPVVASDVGGIPEIVSDGVTGLLVPFGDPQAFEVAVRRILDDADLRRRLVAGASERVEREYTRDRMIDRYIELFDKLR